MKFWKLLFYIQRVLFPPKVDVLDEPSKEVQLVQLKKKKRKWINSKCLKYPFYSQKEMVHCRMRFKRGIWPTQTSNPDLNSLNICWTPITSCSMNLSLICNWILVLGHPLLPSKKFPSRKTLLQKIILTKSSGLSLSSN